MRSANSLSYSACVQLILALAAAQRLDGAAPVFERVMRPLSTASSAVAVLSDLDDNVRQRLYRAFLAARMEAPELVDGVHPTAVAELRASMTRAAPTPDADLDPFPASVRCSPASPLPAPLLLLDGFVFAFFLSGRCQVCREDTCHGGFVSHW